MNVEGWNFEKAKNSISKHEHNIEKFEKIATKSSLWNLYFQGRIFLKDHKAYAWSIKFSKVVHCWKIFLINIKNFYTARNSKIFPFFHDFENLRGEGIWFNNGIGIIGEDRGVWRGSSLSSPILLKWSRKFNVILCTTKNGEMLIFGGQKVR